MNRTQLLTVMSRAIAALCALACISVSLVPGAPAARGAGTVAIAVMSPTDTAGASPQVVQQVGQAIYDGLVASGQYDVRGGGPLHSDITPAGDSLGSAASAASRVNAAQVLQTDILSVSNGKILYRMTTYRVDPLTFGRSQVFQQAFPPGDQHAFAAAFATGVAALEAGRTYTGIIYAIGTDGITSDTGAANGFHIGERFNVVRSGKKVAEAQITSITDVSAAVAISNPTPNYQAQVGDLLISQEPGPAIASSGTNNGGNSALTIIGILVGVGAALLALGHQGQPATVLCPGPTPSGPACVTPSPTGSGVGAFTVAQTSVNNTNPANPVIVYTFTQPVQNASTFPFGTIANIFVLDQVPPNPAGPPQPLTSVGGALAMFDATGTILTINFAGGLTIGHAYFINFTSATLSTTSIALVPNSFRYPSSGTVTSLFRQPMPAAHQVNGNNTTGGNHENNGAGAGGNNNGGPAPGGPKPGR